MIHRVATETIVSLQTVHNHASFKQIYCDIFCVIVDEEFENVPVKRKQTPDDHVKEAYVEAPINDEEEDIMIEVSVFNLTRWTS